jgi:hypothetical protein
MMPDTFRQMDQGPSPVEENRFIHRSNVVAGIVDPGQRQAFSFVTPAGITDPGYNSAFGFSRRGISYYQVRSEA